MSGTSAESSKSGLPITSVIRQACALVGSHRVIIAYVRNRQKSWGFRGVSPHFLEVFETLEIVLDLKITFDSILLECSHHVADGKTRQLGSFSKRSLSILV